MRGGDDAVQNAADGGPARRPARSRAGAAGAAARDAFERHRRPATGSAPAPLAAATAATEIVTAARPEVGTTAGRSGEPRNGNDGDAAPVGPRPSSTDADRPARGDGAAVDRSVRAAVDASRPAPSQFWEQRPHRRLAAIAPDRPRRSSGSDRTAGPRVGAMMNEAPTTPRSAAHAASRGDRRRSPHGRRGAGGRGRSDRTGRADDAAAPSAAATGTTAPPAHRKRGGNGATGAGRRSTGGRRSRGRPRS